MKINNISNTKFSASTVHLEHITTALNCLTPFGSKDDVLIFIDADGLSFVRECNHVIRIQLFLSKELFISYSYENDTDEQAKLCVKINHILDSVSVVNRNMDDIVECTLSYDGYGSPFVLIFEDSMISERVEYSTYLINAMDNNGLDLDRDQVMFECIIKGDILYAALKDVKEIGCKDCYLYAKSNENGENVFALISKSQLGFSKITLPGSRSILEKLEVYDEDFTTLRHGKSAMALFDFNLLDKIRASTKIASKVLLRMDAHGLLSVNILSHTDDVIITDTRAMSNRGKSFNSSKQLQLPKDYPGIVIEVCMLEKEGLDGASRTEIEMFMEGNELEESDKIVKRRINNHESETIEDNTNLLGLNNKKTKVSEAADQSNDGIDENPNVPKFSTSDIPLFF